MPDVIVHYFASARDAAGVSRETVEAATLDSLLCAVRGRHDAALSRILDVSSLLLDGVRVSDPATPLPRGGELHVLPPFAGG